MPTQKQVLDQINDLSRRLSNLERRSSQRLELHSKEIGKLISLGLDERLAELENQSTKTSTIDLSPCPECGLSTGHLTGCKVYMALLERFSLARSITDDLERDGLLEHDETRSTDTMIELAQKTIAETLEREGPF